MKRCRPSLAGVILAFAMPLAAAADEPPAVQPEPVPATAAVPAAAGGESTRAWLALQRSGAAASARSQPLSGEVMENVYARYLKSFTHPVPDQLDPRDASR